LNKLDFLSTKVNGAIDTIQTVQKDIKSKEKKKEGLSKPFVLSGRK
jgi:FtsZ-binding cell division protein ZapB